MRTRSIRRMAGRRPTLLATATLLATVAAVTFQTGPAAAASNLALGRPATGSAPCFGLLNQHFPKHLENDNRNFVYDRRMNAGEFVHFMSGAVGRDLSAMAAQAFNSGFNRAQFDQARQAFPGITY